MAKVEKPVKMTDETVKRLEDAFSLDCTVPEACLYANITKQTYYNWVESFPELKERFDSLRLKPFLKARQTIVKNLDDPEYAFKYMERKNKKEFALRTELSGPDGEDFEIKVIKFDSVKKINGNIAKNNDNNVDRETGTGVGSS